MNHEDIARCKDHFIECTHPNCGCEAEMASENAEEVVKLRAALQAARKRIDK